MLLLVSPSDVNIIGAKPLSDGSVFHVSDPASLQGNHAWPRNHRPIVDTVPANTIYFLSIDEQNLRKLLTALYVRRTDGS
jgi:hypothetical protein